MSAVVAPSGCHSRWTLHHQHGTVLPQRAHHSLQDEPFRDLHARRFRLRPAPAPPRAGASGTGVRARRACAAGRDRWADWVRRRRTDRSVEPSARAAPSTSPGTLRRRACRRPDTRRRPDGFGTQSRIASPEGRQEPQPRACPTCHTVVKAHRHGQRKRLEECGRSGDGAMRCTICVRDAGWDAHAAGG